MSAYEDALDKIRAAACTVCLGNGTLAGRDAFSIGGVTHSEQTIRTCPSCDGSGFEQSERRP